VIGIVAKRKDDEDSGFVGILEYYTDYFSQFEPTVLIPPLTLHDWVEILPTLSMVVLPGGGDLITTRYGSVPNHNAGNPDYLLEYFDQTLLTSALNSNTLVVGICRGLQSLGIQCGLQKYFRSHLPNHPHSINWQDTAHNISITDRDGTSWTRLTNSLHHQGFVIPTTETFNDIRILATADYGKTEKIIEAFEGNNFLAVQWHPEVVNDLMVIRWINTRLAGQWVYPL
jgi:putative glutamine amidotransferase